MAFSKSGPSLDVIPAVRSKRRWTALLHLSGGLCWGLHSQRSARPLNPASRARPATSQVT